MSALARIPLPFKRFDLTVREHSEQFPVSPTWAPGIVHVEIDGHRLITRMTVQCSVCLRTATGRSATACVILGGWDFHPDPGELGHTNHRRCPDCRSASRHPAEQLDLLDHLEETS
ncbi:hypothetical protein [Brachybacterium subflavum]|uniref:hypothetical protein n=1 Tax=Brachybacterium subflavum TaxID=2585206 RepID=UPI0012662BF3|nr:hypothetical protein [Brachybacterium subflavum]